MNIGSDKPTHTPPGFNSNLPLVRASTIPREWYVSPEMYLLEREKIFRGSWQVAGRTDQLKEPGSFLTANLAGEPVVVCRDKQGSLRAFSNVCRHRAARVVTKCEGKASFFQCRYHGWTYDLAGTLKGTPEFDGAEAFQKSDLPLPSWSVATWGPLVFVHAGKNPPPLEQFFGPFFEQMKEVDLGALKFTYRKNYTIECNWKVFVDNYLDGGYHVNTIHPSLAGVLDYAHYRSELFGNSSLQSSPMKSGQDPEVAKVRKGDRAFYWWLFPNLMINVYAGTMDTNLVLPLGPDRCEVIFDFYFSDTEGEAARDFIDQSIKVAHQVQLEDLDICEDVQRGLHSVTWPSGRFSPKRENAGFHFQQMLNDWLKA